VNVSPGQYCILLAEDDSALRYLISRALSQGGYCVIEASDGHRAMAREAEFDGTIHMLVTDVHMPGIDGHELAREMKQRRPDMKVLIVSGEQEADFPPEARSHDFALLKPIEPAAVVEKVTQLLGKPAPL
jgi:two-component system cell cycle sensor histidine kinase/response regulator CckA